jgi:multicomponent Na+:H+ antiporter subunit E
MRVALARAAFFLAFWLMISGWGLPDLPVGLAAVCAATWVSLRLLPKRRSQLRIGALLALAASFLRQSVTSGADVALRALSPDMNLKPGFVSCPLRLPEGSERNGFCAFSSLLPGTLPTGADDKGDLLVHCLDVRQPVAANLASEELLFMRAFSLD